MAKRFIVQDKDINVTQNNITIFGDEAHHINVLRHKVNDVIYINEYKVKINKMNKNSVEGNIIGNLEQKGIPAINITLIQSYLKTDKMEYVVQKAVELGVKKITPVLSKNCVVKLDEKDKTKKIERLIKIAKEAVGQCGRTDEVIINNVENLSTHDFSQYDAVLICHEESANSLKIAINSIVEKNIENIAVIIGPEGGLVEKEVNMLLKNNNAYVVSLGERILRAETASFAMLSILWYEFGDKKQKS